MIRITASKALPYLSASLLVVWTVVPIYWIANISLMSGLELLSPGLYPKSPTLSNYYELIFRENILGYAVNTIFVSLLAMIISLTLAVPAAYSVTKLRMNPAIRNVFLAWTLFSRTVPPIVPIIPLYAMFANLRVLDNLSALAIAYQVYTLPFSLWILMGFFRGVSVEVEDAAMVDGAGRLTILSRILVPLILPGIVATSIFCLIMTWSDFLYAVILLQSQPHFTLSLLVASYISEFGIKWGDLAAAGLLSSLPLLVFTGIVQKYLVLGFTQT